ncbi:MAG: hypothetical protein AVDCRST_MAG41-3127, partial [uncultured Corynebacteriales bacterium]
PAGATRARPGPRPGPAGRGVPPAGPRRRAPVVAAADRHPPAGRHLGRAGGAHGGRAGRGRGGPGAVRRPLPDRGAGRLRRHPPADRHAAARRAARGPARAAPTGGDGDLGRRADAAALGGVVRTGGRTGDRRAARGGPAAGAGHHRRRRGRLGRLAGAGAVGGGAAAAGGGAVRGRGVPGPGLVRAGRRLVAAYALARDRPRRRAVDGPARSQHLGRGGRPHAVQPGDRLADGPHRRAGGGCGAARGGQPRCLRDRRRAGPARRRKHRRGRGLVTAGRRQPVAAALRRHGPHAAPPPRPHPPLGRTSRHLGGGVAVGPGGGPV